MLPMPVTRRKSVAGIVAICGSHIDGRRGFHLRIWQPTGRAREAIAASTLFLFSASKAQVSRCSSFKNLAKD